MEEPVTPIKPVVNRPPINRPPVNRSPVQREIVQKPKVKSPEIKPKPSVKSPSVKNKEVKQPPLKRAPTRRPNRPQPPRKLKNRKPRALPDVRDMPDYDSMTEQQQAAWHADFNIKLGILRNAYPKFDIPHLDENVPLEIKHQHYERYVQQIHLDNSVGNYKFYLLILFAIIELICVKVLGLDLGGYTINQLTMLNKYERLLIELGEKSYAPSGSEWPVEVRIVMLSLFNAVVFLVIRLFASYLGPGVGDVLQQIVNAFMNNEDASSHIKKAQKIGINADTDEYADGVPEPPANGGFDFGSLINGLGGMLGNMGGNNNQARTTSRSSRTPTFRE